ncbi:DNA mismatch repair endonuclease MutL [Rubrobacter aplysinae]|uniref:DNA mismatch repair endonuclease MutL n=1 Tax=Rubrobacter aplysinae TaxID=909625 RepID=UPI00064BD262|nr:DNA mismatch repair endonuclease MutL [Rubrobacter aplysinae]
MADSASQTTNVRVLDPRVAQQVAADEVVDRPASVVKELVENALDAGATRVEVELGDGGTSHILVRDDGSGMSAEDARASVLRHATSKIQNLEDLEAVTTLGFRGEALPSIASVSAFRLTTSTGEGTATKVTVDGGGPAEVTGAAHPKGTTVLADRLLYNVPARRAFLKGTRAERAAIIEAVTHLAVAHPEVAFRLSEKGRDYLSLPEAGELPVRLAQIHGVAKARAMREVHYESGAFEVTGYAALPSVTEGSRSAQTVAVNGRWVRGESLQRGLDDAYRATVPGGRYPPVAIQVTVDPRRVDVNVHPTKQVVRFSEERAARDAVAAAVRDAIEWHPAAPATTPSHPEPRFQQDRIGPPEGKAPRVAERGADYGAQTQPAERPQRDLAAFRERISDASTPLSELSRSSEPGAREPEAGHAGGLPERGALPPLEGSRVIGQLAAGYILLEEPAALWIVDQHVAHERVLLDRLNDAGSREAPDPADPDSTGPATMQGLLMPHVVELSPAEAELAVDHLEELAVYGFEAEPFGPRSYRVTAIISTLADADVSHAFKDALAAVSGTGSGRHREDRILATIACHSAVKMGDRLSQEEMQRLIQDWLTTRLPATCPHGRSICYRTDLSEIARKLDRH